mgnify:CR=1 FL=1
MKKIIAAISLSLMIAGAVVAGNVTPIGDLQRGSMVTVSGTVERILDTDEFRLADGTGSVRVYIGPNWVPAQVGEQVSVSGFVDDDFGPKEIYARTLTHADGTVVQFEHRYD